MYYIECQTILITYVMSLHLKKITKSTDQYCYIIMHAQYSLLSLEH